MIVFGSEKARSIDSKYRLVRLVGAGSVGVVYEAYDQLRDRRVAIKWVRPSLSGSPEHTARFLREARVAALIQHPNIVDVYELGNDDGSPFLVMELLEGQPLSEWLLGTQEPLHRVLSLLVAAMRGVSALHAAGVIHRDLKPDNIFLSREGDDGGLVPKVLDFGLSKLTTLGVEDPSLTLQGTTFGTPAYGSYEQLVCARDVDARTDIYAFGVILYEAITGTLPFNGATFGEVALQIGAGEPIAPKRLRPEIPTALDRLVLWAMARDREQRVQTMDQLILELEAFTTSHRFESQRTLPSTKVPEVCGGAKTPVPTKQAMRVAMWLCVLVVGTLAILRVTR